MQLPTRKMCGQYISPDFTSLNISEFVALNVCARVCFTRVCLPSFRRQMLYESAESMARPGGVNPSEVIELLNDINPQCPVQLQTLRFKPWRQPPPPLPPPPFGVSSAMAASPATPASAAAAGTVAPPSEQEGESEETEELEKVRVRQKKQSVKVVGAGDRVKTGGGERGGRGGRGGPGVQRIGWAGEVILQ